MSVKVWREFRTIFGRQEQMKTFPQYDGTEVKGSQWGRKSASAALRKEANWIPFIQVRDHLYIQVKRAHHKFLSVIL